MTEINNLDHAIEISIKKYLYSQIFKKGTQKIPALVPHPTVWFNCHDFTGQMRSRQNVVETSLFEIEK